MVLMRKPAGTETCPPRRRQGRRQQGCEGESLRHGDATRSHGEERTGSALRNNSVDRQGRVEDGTEPGWVLVRGPVQ